MANFIVIGTDNRFTDLVDGIEKCLPLNPNVETHLSTGKIEKRNGGIIYKYLINGDIKEEDNLVSFCDLLLNQIAAFRQAYSARDLLHIFVLENPMSPEELQELNGWMQEIADVYAQDKEIYIHRVCFDYDMSTPNDVTRRIPSDVLYKYIESQKDFSFFEGSADILYLHNRDFHGAAIVPEKEDHNFLLPRVLTDFMMLLSSTNSTYSVINAINQSPERCVSIGYAESMYYFPDVKAYYELADPYSLYEYILTCDDETQGNPSDSEAIDIVHYPLGLHKRKERLKKYEDVSYDTDINLHKNSADFIIDYNLLKLKNMLLQKCQEDVEQKRQEIEEKIQELDNNENRGEKEEKLRKELDDFIEDLPHFISRQDILNHYRGFDNEDEKEDYLKQAGEQYSELIKYAKGNDFYDYVKEYEENKPKIVEAAPENNFGCLAGICSFLKKPTKEEQPSPPVEQSSLLKCVNDIRTQTELKEKYKSFKDKISKIDDRREEEKKACDKFRLSEHSHHFYHLINLDKMKEYQKEKFDERLQRLVGEWNNEKKEVRTLARLIELLQEDTTKHTDTLKYIDWNDPFPFVSDTSDDKLIQICNQLYDKSSPFVHYETIVATAQDNINIALYSDIPNMQEKFDNIRGKIIDGTRILPYYSTHVASKICFFQILPLDSGMLQNIYEMHE